MRASAMSYYKGAIIDEVSKTVRIRRSFVCDVVANKHRAFWAAFFGCADGESPKFDVIGKILRIPNIAGEHDSLNFFVDGMNVNEILSEPDAEAA